MSIRVEDGGIITGKQVTLHRKPRNACQFDLSSAIRHFKLQSLADKNMAVRPRLPATSARCEIGADILKCP